MRRKLFTLCSTVSLLLCAAVCVLWAISFWPMPPTFVVKQGRMDPPSASLEAMTLTR
jgi:hypothetical protein